jgi:glycerol-3-phosphate dehydrogenase subunit C
LSSSKITGGREGSLEAPIRHPIDFPHLMLRAKAVKAKKGEVRTRDRILSSTDAVGSLAGIPVVVQLVNAANGSAMGRKLLEKTLGLATDAPIPQYHSNTARKRLAGRGSQATATPTAETRGKVVLFTTCYGNRNEPDLNLDLVAVFEHNGIPVKIVSQEKCCGMPKLDLGDLETVARH